jgi:Tol biopolymer transport system component
MQQVTGGEGATYPFWSPDSHSIGFFGGAKLKTVDIVGGAVRILGDAPAGLGGAWASDGTVIFAPAPGGPLLRINAAGGVPTPATTILHAASGQHHSYPALLPDGRHFLYLVDWSSPGENPGDGIYLGSLDSERPRRVFEMKGNVFFASGHLLYVRDRSLVAQPFHPGRFEFTGPAVPLAEQELDKDPGFLQSGFTASQNGVLVFQSATDSSSRLVWSESSGKVSGQITEGSFKDPHLSPDGRFLAVASDDDHNGKRFIRVLDLERGVSMRLTDDGNDEFPTWSRDGKRITYLTGAARGNSISVNEVSADGSAPPRVLLKGGMMIPNDWSPDGHLALMNLGNGPVNLAVYSAADQKLSVFSPTGAEAQFSPDGKWLAFQALGSRNGGEITVQAFPGPGARIQISNAGGAQVRWSRDGKRIYYIQPDKKLMEVNFDSARGTAGTPRTLFQTRIVAANLVLFQYDVAPDGRFLVNSFLASNSSPLTLLTGWTALLRGRSQ